MISWKNWTGWIKVRQRTEQLWMDFPSSLCVETKIWAKQKQQACESCACGKVRLDIAVKKSSWQKRRGNRKFWLHNKNYRRPRFHKFYFLSHTFYSMNYSIKKIRDIIKTSLWEFWQSFLRSIVFWILSKYKSKPIPWNQTSKHNLSLFENSNSKFHATSDFNIETKSTFQNFFNWVWVCPKEHMWTQEIYSSKYLIKSEEYFRIRSQRTENVWRAFMWKRKL